MAATVRWHLTLWLWAGAGALLTCAVGGTVDISEGAGAYGRVRVELNLA